MEYPDVIPVVNSTVPFPFFFFFLPAALTSSFASEKIAQQTNNFILCEFRQHSKLLKVIRNDGCRLTVGDARFLFVLIWRRRRRALFGFREPSVGGVTLLVFAGWSSRYTVRIRSRFYDRPGVSGGLVTRSCCRRSGWWLVVVAAGRRRARYIGIRLRFYSRPGGFVVLRDRHCRHRFCYVGERSSLRIIRILSRRCRDNDVVARAQRWTASRTRRSRFRDR